MMRKNVARELLLWQVSAYGRLIYGTRNRRLAVKMQHQGLLLIDGRGEYPLAHLTKEGWAELRERMGEEQLCRLKTAVVDAAAEYAELRKVRA